MGIWEKLNNLIAKSKWKCNKVTVKLTRVLHHVNVHDNIY